ncbi:unnamed protein product [Adineta ricciae]|uniref:BRCT domain-containing protein n=1 Tax=Adineta ricciae TaxID=249248 RepID=A0A815CGT4_ADIRI|nr:unnamed protein product [Adineta ricciae]
MMTINDDDDDEDEPFFRIHFVPDESIANYNGYWEQYTRATKCWTRLCLKCPKEVWQASGNFCKCHYNQLESREMVKKTKRLRKKGTNKKQKSSLELVNEIQIEKIEKDENDNISESLGIVISVTSSLNKKQFDQINQFITKFHTASNPIQLTCESQPEYIDDTTTHMITNDCGSSTTVLSKQIVQACVRHIFVSSIQWIASSLEQSRILDHFPYEILRDKRSPANTRGIKQCRFDNLPVFPSSCIISVECHSGVKSLKMTRNELIEIVELSGATLFNDHSPCQRLIVLCNSKGEMLNVKQRNDNDFKLSTTISYCKPEFLFDSIVRHEMQIIDDYCW